MIRWIALLAVSVGLFVGMGLPRSASGNLTGAQLAIALTPPTLSSGSNTELNCGWHTDCVTLTSGVGLDWEDGPGYGNWYFRGFFYVSDASRIAFRMFPLVTVQDPDRCDVMTVWIAELHSGQLMAIPIYEHVNITDNRSFDWYGGPWTVYNDRKIGTTIDDNGSSCHFTGSHVHEAHVSGPLSSYVTTTTDGSYPTVQQCHVVLCSQLGYGPYANNSILNWTRRFAWAEGAAPH